MIHHRSSGFSSEQVEQVHVVHVVHVVFFSFPGLEESLVCLPCIFGLFAMHQ